MTADNPQKQSIMVVDDQPANLKLLEDMLKQHGYGVRSFPRGRLALVAASQNPPDLILLDINMPEMNGYEVCARLKSDVKLSRIPVIFLSALDETEDKLKAFKSGAVDYVTKPFQLDEVQARVETHLQLQNLERALKLHNDHLEELVQSRTRELGEAHEQLKILDRAKTDFLTLISHEFRTPLNGILGFGELLLDQLSPDESSEQFRNMFEQSRRRILAILDDALLLTRIEVGAEKSAAQSVCLDTAFTEAIGRVAELAQSRAVTLSHPFGEAHTVQGSRELVVKALAALLETAVRFSKTGEAVRIACRRVGDSVQVVIESIGSTLPQEVIPKFFDLFSMGEAITRDGDFGLGPPVAHRILSLFGGSVGVENCSPMGVRLTVSFRRAEDPTNSTVDQHRISSERKESLLLT